MGHFLRRAEGRSHLSKRFFNLADNWRLGRLRQAKGTHNVGLWLIWLWPWDGPICTKDVVNNFNRVLTWLALLWLWDREGTGLLHRFFKFLNSGASLDLLDLRVCRRLFACPTNGDLFTAYGY